MRRRGQSLWIVLTCVALVPALTATVLRVVPPTDDTTALVASFIAYGLVGYLIALVCLVVALVRARRRRVLAVVTLLVAGLTALQLSWMVPFFVPDDRPVSTPTFTVMSLNMYKGLADSAQVYAVARRADVVVLVETTPIALNALKGLGWSERFPYAVGDLAPGISDTAIFSRFPLEEGVLLGRTSFQQWMTAVKVPGIGSVELVAAHPCNPYCGHQRWAGEHDLLRRTLAPLLGDRLVVAGDFNAVDDHGPMQALRADGLRSATDLTGAGWMPTYPANRSFPPLLPIDHVLVSQRMTATEIHSFRVAGTDHLGVFATLAGSG
ncbi:MAG TPA: endonuclease/exonuclease/phosphatase family protein [Propionibacteriaceae bacterium]